MNIVVFRIQDREYGINISQVSQIIRARKITPVPEAADFIEGVIILRGKVLPVVNLRKKLGIASKASDKKWRMIITRIESHSLAIIVDAASDVLAIEEGNITPPDEVLHEAKYLIGLVNLDNRLILLVDMVKLLTQEEVVDAHKVSERVEVRKKA